MIVYLLSLHAAATAGSFSWITLAVQIRFYVGVLGPTTLGSSKSADYVYGSD